MIKRAPIAPHNLALLRFIRQHQPVGTYDAFSVFEGAGENVKAFAHRLAYLQQAGWLRNVGSTYLGLWSISEKAVELIDHGPCPAPVLAVPVDHDEDDESGPAGTIVPPRRIDMMHGPLYRPPVMSYREGAMDFEACPSITAGRPVPFRGGRHG